MKTLFWGLNMLAIMAVTTPPVLAGLHPYPPLSPVLISGAAGTKTRQTTVVSDINKAGEALRRLYLSMNVENLWIAGHHINWETGQPDQPGAVQGTATHCSAFVAAACKYAGIYILRPPEHKQILLANAQYTWLTAQTGSDHGWSPVTVTDHTYLEVQNLANTGNVVVAVYKNSNPHKPGHIALVMPATVTLQMLADQGPVVIMAGTHNHAYISLRKGFKSHITDWPSSDVQFFTQRLLKTE